MKVHCTSHRAAGSCERWLERNVIRLHIEIRVTRFRFLRGSAWSMGPTRGGRGSFGFRSASKELHVLANHPEARTFLPRLLVVPGIQLQAAFNKNGTALFQILTCNFGLTSPQSYVNKSGLFSLLAIFP